MTSSPENTSSFASSIPESAADGRKRTIYVFVRTDISLEQQMVQASHAAAEAARRFYRPEHGIASLIVLSASSPARLRKAQAQLQALGIEHDTFFEPSWDMGESAVGTRPLLEAERPLLKGWQLWKATPAVAPRSAERQEAAAC